jgi:hypothetical protein
MLLLHVSVYYNICSALILLHLGPRTAADAIEAFDPINVSSYYIYVSSYCYISVLILLHMRPHTGQSPYVRAD